VIWLIDGSTTAKGSLRLISILIFDGESSCVKVIVLILYAYSRKAKKIAP
jgi:hypothetical protein